MKQIEDAGCIFDTIRYLAWRAYELSGATPPDNPYYRGITRRLKRKDFMPPRMLFAFWASTEKSESLLHLVLFDNVLLNRCTKMNALNTLKNKGYMQRRFIEHYFPDMDPRIAMERIRSKEGLDFISLYDMDPVLTMAVYSVVIYMDDALSDLVQIFELVYEEVKREQNDFLKAMPAFLPTDGSPAAEKLFAITKATYTAGAQTSVSLSLMEAQLIHTWAEENVGFLLGFDYISRLESAEFKYANIRPSHLAMALGNESKYAIFEALAKKSPMTRSQMEKELHLSRAALDHNLKEMRDIGLVTVGGSHRQFMYELDLQFLLAVGRKIIAIAERKQPAS